MEHLNHVIDHLDKMEKRIMTAFIDVQAVVDGYAATAATIAAGISEVQTDIGTALNGTVDLSALNTNLGNAQAALTALAAIVPAPVEPAPVEAT